MVPLLAAKDVSAGHGLDRSNFTHPACAPASLRTGHRGHLKNGNRSGDFLAAPRCGAKTRVGGCCRQPAMRNGRCRLHGGLSTGPRTPEGLARSRRARLTHGGGSARVRALLSAARRQTRCNRALRARLAGSSAGHGVHRSNSAPAPGTSARKVDHRGHREAVLTAARAARIPPSSVRSVSSEVPPSPAGHGVHRSNHDRSPLHRRSI